MSLDRDLVRWESGAVTDEEFLRDHPEADLGGLLSLHERMSAMGTEPVPLDEVALQRFLGALPDRARPRRRGRSLLLAVAAVLLTASMAVAMPGVRHGVTAVTHSVGRLLGIESGSTTTPAPSGTTPAPSGTTPATLGGGAGDHQGASGGATGPNDHDAAEHEGGGTHGSDGAGSGDGDETGVGDGTGGGGQDQQGDEGSGSGGDQGGGGSGSDDSSS
ncbi:MAG: hypothetical protein H0W82_03005, partial [Actinobacteria bacterium]|nr:hypothetical protein [Actinomycetota bacterium]